MSLSSDKVGDQDTTGKPINFLRSFVLYCHDTEIPQLFALWSGIGAISAALGRRVWLDCGIFNVYPNMYIVLVAGSGRMRKSTSIMIAQSMVREMSPKPNIISEKITTEALIEALQVCEVSDPSRLLEQSNTGFVFADELSTFLNRQSYEQGLAPALIKLFDCSNFSYRTKSRGVESLDNPCLGMLGASTIEWIRNAIPADAVGGGLTSRFIFVYQDKPSESVAWPVISDELKRLRQLMICSLSYLSTLEGIATLSQGAMDLFVEEYKRFRSPVALGGSPLFDDVSTQGYASRRHIHMLKIALAFSVSERRDLIICDNHIQGAIGLLQQTEGPMTTVLKIITASEQGSIISRVSDIIRSRRKIARPLLLRVISHQISTRELTEVLDTLIAMGRVRAESQNGSIYYLWIFTPEELKQLG